MNKPPAAQAAAAATAAQNATEYVVRVPKASRRRFNMMRFHQSLGVDFKAWTAAKMERENNQKEFRSLDDEMPKFGAGSEYGRDQREEARRKKYGINMRRYVSENQPWLLTTGSKESRKKFKGIREGGVSENSSWYVFMQGKDGAFEAFPVEEWYNFKMIQRYNTLTAEEAEEQFEKRDKIMNFHALRWEKKLKQDVEDPDEEEKGKKKTKSTKSLLISELDDWMSSGESNEEAEGEDGVSKPKKKKAFKKGSRKRAQKGGSKRKNEEGDSEDDCFEESDEYDEMAEHEYISSDSSDSDAENDELVRKELAGVAEEDALKKLLNSDESSEDEEKKKEREKAEKKEKEEGEEGEEKEKEKKKKKKKKKDKKEQKDSDADSSSDEDKKENSKKKKKGGDGDKDEGGKRKMKNQAGDGAQNKKLKPDAANGDAGASGSGAAAAALPPPGSESGVTEEAIRRYLMRKPMTTIELLQKFKNKKTGLSSDQLVRAIAAILKRINPIKQMVKGKMYLSFKQV